MTRPVIGITMDHETVQTYSKFPWYALRQNYAGSVTECGGVPLPLPHEPSLVETYLDMIDGLIITGGAFDVPPSMYGATVLSDTVEVKDARTAFEAGMTRGALARNMPILGICGGQQLLNVLLGGTLIQHISDVVQSDIEHEQPNPRDEVGHAVDVVADTQLAKIVSNAARMISEAHSCPSAAHNNIARIVSTPIAHYDSNVTAIGDKANQCTSAMKKNITIMVNSAHHQAADAVGGGVVINARALDGVIEGIEYPAHPFCLGLQWHPEFLITGADRAVYDAFVAACKAYEK